MSLDFSRDFFILIATALTGGIVAKFIRLQPFVGFIVAGVVARLFLPENAFGIEKVAELGLIFLLFSTGLELSLARLSKVIRISLTGASVQIVLVTLVSFALLKMFSFDSTSALVLSLGFSLSSTAIVVKTLIDKDEANSIHGEVMVGWLLIQDLAVIPMVMIVGYLKGGDLYFWNFACNRSVYRGSCHCRIIRAPFGAFRNKTIERPFCGNIFCISWLFSYPNIYNPVFRSCCRSHIIGNHSQSNNKFYCKYFSGLSWKNCCICRNWPFTNWRIFFYPFYLGKKLGDNLR